MADEQFGPYVLVELLGRGRHGEVHRAVDTGKSRTVAAKRLRLELATDEQFQTRFRRETALAARTSAPHVVPIHDYGEIDGRLFIEMPLVRGCDLATVLKQGPLPVPRRRHRRTGRRGPRRCARRRPRPPRRGAVHRGAHRYGPRLRVPRRLRHRPLRRRHRAHPHRRDRRHHRLHGAERFHGDSLDHRVDVDALACLLFEALTGSRPFLADEPLARMYLHLHSPPPSCSERRPGVPAALDAVVARGMAEDAPSSVIRPPARSPPRPARPSGPPAPCPSPAYHPPALFPRPPPRPRPRPRSPRHRPSPIRPRRAAAPSSSPAGAWPPPSSSPPRSLRRCCSPPEPSRTPRPKEPSRPRSTPRSPSARARAASTSSGTPPCSPSLPVPVSSSSTRR